MKAAVVNGRMILLRKITEAELLNIESLRGRVVMAKHNLEAAERALAEAEAEVVAKLEAGVGVVAKSNLHAGIAEEIGPRRPEWKEIYLDHMEGVHGCPRKAQESGILETTAGKPKQVLRITHRFNRSVQ